MGAMSAFWIARWRLEILFMCNIHPYREIMYMQVYM